MKQVYQRTFKNGDVCAMLLDATGEEFVIKCVWKTKSGKDEPDWSAIQDEYDQWRTDCTRHFVDSTPSDKCIEVFTKVAARFFQSIYDQT